MNVSFPLKTDILANQYIVDLVKLDSQPNEMGLSLHRRKLGEDSFASYMMDAHVHL